MPQENVQQLATGNAKADIESLIQAVNLLSHRIDALAANYDQMRKEVLDALEANKSLQTVVNDLYAGRHNKALEDAARTEAALLALLGADREPS